MKRAKSIGDGDVLVGYIWELDIFWCSNFFNVMEYY
jgi:hypothetical protein